MSAKLVLNSNLLLSKVFSFSSNGYDAAEVDAYLDEIIKDYKEIEGNVLISKSDLKILNEKIDALRKENENLAIENKSFKKRLDGIKESDSPNKSNIDLFRRINKLETFLWKKGFDPKEIK
jgi:DivIVA domain-containing protein